MKRYKISSNRPCTIGAEVSDHPDKLRRTGHLIVAVAMMGGAGLYLAGPAGAAPTGGSGKTFAELRAAHLSPTMPGVDVYLGSFSGATSTEWISGVRYGAVSPYRQIKTGLYTVSVRKHGAPAGSAAILSWTLDARAGKAYTVAGVGAGPSVRGVVLADDLTTPPAGAGRVRVIQAASRASTVTVQALMGPTIVKKAKFATASSYSEVSAGSWSLAAASDEDPAVKASAVVEVQSGQTQSVLVLDAAQGGITVRSLLDSAASTTMPKGPIDAGGGGTATAFTSGERDGAHPLAWSLTLLTALAAAASLTGWNRHRRAAHRHAAA